MFDYPQKISGFAKRHHYTLIKRGGVVICCIAWLDSCALVAKLWLVLLQLVFNHWLANEMIDAARASGGLYVDTGHLKPLWMVLCHGKGMVSYMIHAFGVGKMQTALGSLHEKTVCIWVV